jgi:putative nucleotidyltransferase with HDIG domain
MSARAKLFVWGVTVVGSIAVADATYAFATSFPGPWWLILAALTLISGTATVRLPSTPATISVSETFLFAAVILFGPAAGVMMVVLESVIIGVRRLRAGTRIPHLLFNVAAPSLALWAGAASYSAFGIPPLVDLQPDQSVPISQLILPLTVFTLVYFCLSSGLVAVAVALTRGLPPFKVWRDDFAWLFLNFLAGGSIAAILVAYTKRVDWTSLAVTIPLLLVLYMTFRTSMARVADAHKHLGELNALYLTTIQTLAAAIDAKDQVTHDHIRRVQRFALALAGGLGVRDELQLRAIQAAAMLHDTGKIAVPDAILNKPEPLDPAELAVMRQHASVGADIVASIQFPYPVEPIVRHHHENWDGSGYPSGLMGTDIPIGARILSVVDCFDALTSDRPYRRRLTDDEAIALISARRGSLYDPLVVDAFVALLPELQRENAMSAAREGTPDPALPLARSRTASAQLRA